MPSDLSPDQNAQGEETSPDRQGGFVIATHAPSLTQAELIASVLQSEGLDAVVYDASVSSWMPHWEFAMHSRGIPVAVPAGQIDRAGEILARKSEAKAEQAEPPTSQADILARRAFIASVFGLFITPIVLMAAWYLLLACIAAARSPASERKEFTPYAIFTLTFIASSLAAFYLFFFR